MSRLWSQGAGKYQKQNQTYSFWQKTNHPIELNFPEIIDQKIDYIHNNPVEAGYVTNPESWYYSSACVVSPLKVLDTLAGDLKYIGHWAQPSD